ncbi:hypothetical protein [Colwellia psychrerythraea]|uniref:Uncharacterized protein n=1 Tax=Colwellia psychrerythraea TaxID=28229 RepID=A0A099K8P3_COLPS|nr:hypothetical protein [Colwellia psychrerythraea]KGJ86462.1 hypothetical protein GAB14E_0735 [Colwellia psychrerythraea]
MLIKIQTDIFLDNNLDDLKGHFEVGTASKAVSNAATTYLSCYESKVKAERKVERLTGIIEEMRALVRAKQSAEESLQILLGEKL